jgi:hypothetical protein
MDNVYVSPIMQITYMQHHQISAENVVGGIIELTTADPIRLRIETRNRHIYDVLSVLFDVTMHI